MVTCAWCDAIFEPSGRRRYCSDACKQASWRARQASSPAAGPITSSPQTTIYECPSCERRYLGARRCEDCQLFCRRIGPGGLCPNCDEPVAHADLNR